MDRFYMYACVLVVHLRRNKPIQCLRSFSQPTAMYHGFNFLVLLIVKPHRSHAKTCYSWQIHIFKFHWKKYRNYAIGKSVCSLQRKPNSFAQNVTSLLYSFAHEYARRNIHAVSLRFLLMNFGVSILIKYTFRKIKDIYFRHCTANTRIYSWRLIRFIFTFMIYYVYLLCQ